MRLYCTRCHRTIAGKVVIVGGQGYGTSCARIVAPPDLLDEAKKRAPRERKPKPAGPLVRLLEAAA